MTWGAIGGAAVATVGGALLGSGGSSSSSSSAPWKKQQPYLTYGFEGTKGALGDALGMGTYGGPRVAGLNPYQMAGADAAAGYGLGQGMANGMGQAAMGMQGMGGLNTYMNNANSLLNNYINGDPTGYAQNMGAAFANNPNVNGMIDASSRDITRNLYENQLPNLSLAATGSGNQNSTRAGIAEGIMQRGAADRIGDIGSTLRGGLYSQGLTSGLNQYNANFTNALSGNNQLYNAANLGNTMVNSGMQNVFNSADAAVKAGQMYQNQNQNEINGSMQAFNDARDTPMNLWSKYMQTIQGNYGGQSTSNSGGGAVGALGGGMAGLGLYNGFRQSFGGQSPFGQQGTASNGFNGQLAYPGYIDMSSIPQY